MSEQRRLSDLAEAIVIAAQQASPTVRLVGGSGLYLLLGHRRSDDLDLFCALREDIEPVVRAVESSAAQVGVQRVRTGPGFARLEIGAGEGLVRVDVASDTSRRLVTEDTLVGLVRVESLRDQRANKLVALLGRSELRASSASQMSRHGWDAHRAELEPRVSAAGGVGRMPHGTKPRAACAKPPRSGAEVRQDF